MNQLKLTELIEVKLGDVVTVTPNGTRNFIKQYFSILKEVEFVDRFSRLIQIIIDFSLLNLIYYCSIKINLIDFTFWNWVLVFESYYLLSELFFNTTVGKKIFGHLIIDIYGNSLSKQKVIIRNISRLIPIDPFSLLGLRSLHDFIAQSYLIHQDELNDLLELRKLNIKELSNGNTLYSLDRLREKTALESKKELIEELNANIKSSRFPGFLVPKEEKIIHIPVKNFFLKKNLSASELFFGPLTLSIIISLPVLYIMNSNELFPEFETIFILSTFFTFMIMLFIKPSIEINDNNIKINNGFKNVINIKSEDCLYAYFTLTRSVKHRQEAIGFLLTNNTEKIIKFNVAKHKNKIGEAIYSWMKHKEESNIKD